MREPLEQGCGNSRLISVAGTPMTFLSLRALPHPNYSLAESHGNVLCCCVTTTEDLSPCFPVLGLLTRDTLETPRTLSHCYSFVFVFFFLTVIDLCIELELFTMNCTSRCSGWKKQHVGKKACSKTSIMMGKIM